MHSIRLMNDVTLILITTPQCRRRLAPPHPNASLLQDAHWADLFSVTEQDDIQSLTETERKRREAVWELFQSECVFLIDHLMVLKHVSFFLLSDEQR